MSVEAGHTYTLAASNLPQPDIGDNAITKQVTIPGEVSPQECDIQYILFDSEKFNVVLFAVMARM